MRRALVIVLDSVGCGEAPDAGDYGDLGANTLGHLYQRERGLRLPNLESLGLAEILGLEHSGDVREGARCFRLTETSAGKDTTTGHWELMGCVLDEPFLTMERFPEEFVRALESVGQTAFLGNKAASGTEILSELGGEHLKTGKPILYTSADSVLQIVAHEERFGLGRLWRLCQQARDLLDDRGMRVGRVIARPFLGSETSGFVRTPNRHDYSLTPDETVLNRLAARGVKVTGVGKISDIFAGSGVEVSHPTAGNREGMAKIGELWNRPEDRPHFVFANLVDFDSLYGHRRDPRGYAACLVEFDTWLGGFLPRIGKDDLVVLTADHGNDPYHPGTDHTREQVPCLVLGPKSAVPENWSVFSDVARNLEAFFGPKTNLANPTRFA